MYFDSHMHLQPEDDAAGLVVRARAAGVDGMIAVGGSDAMNRGALDAAAAFPDTFAAAVAYDCHVAERDGAGAIPQRVTSLRETLGRGTVCAIGETGLDYHYSPATAPVQRDLFAAQLEVARERGLPVIVHSREAEADTLALLCRHRAAWTHDVRRIGVLHCFTGNADLARELVAIGFYVSFSGIMTFRNADTLREAAAVVPDEWLLIETDTPYLAPVPYRGKPNEPAYLPDIARCLANVRNTSAAHIAATTTANAERLFGTSS